MLNPKEKYYVFVGTQFKDIIESWAKENDIKIVGGEVILPRHGRVLELDVRDNEDLHIKGRFLGSGHPALLNEKRQIALIHRDTNRGKMVSSIIYPEIRDR